MKSKTLPAFLFGASLFCVALKSFTFVATYRDDPTVELHLRKSPAWENRLKQSEESSLPPSLIITQDENDLLGRGLYEGLVGWGWIAFPIAWGAALAARLLHRRRGTG